MLWSRVDRKNESRLVLSGKHRLFVRQIENSKLGEVSGNYDVSKTKEAVWEILCRFVTVGFKKIEDAICF